MGSSRGDFEGRRTQVEGRCSMTMRKTEPPDMIEMEVIGVTDDVIEQVRTATAVEAPAKAKRLRDRAEECRALARIMTSAANAASYLNLAEAYDGLAEQQEQLARDIVKFDIKMSTAGPMQWQPIATAPFDRDLGLAVINYDGTNTLVFPCRRIEGGWIDAKTKTRLTIFPTHWREWQYAA
jgi:hypothetical protein